MSNCSIFNLSICPRCGKITVLANDKCPYCQMDMNSLDETFDDIFILNVKKYLSAINSRYYKKQLYDKKLWKNREKSDLNEIKEHGKIVWNNNLRKNIKICPKCARIVTNNYLRSSKRCMYCNEVYIDLKMTAFDYYYPESKGEGYISNKLKKEKEKLGIYDGDGLLAKELRASEPNDDNTIGGVIPTMIAMPGHVAEAKGRLSNFISHYMPVAKKYCLKLDENKNDENLLNEFSYIINHVHNVLRGQRFLGQELAVRFFTLVFIEIEKKYFG